MKQNGSGTLYICPTPIGNMKDISCRVIDCLKYVDLIACEDTRNAKKLLNRLEIKKPLISYYKFNQEEKGKEIIDRLETGDNISLISDAGTPGISDPGSYLVKAAVEKGIKVISLPGPSAAITALCASGFSADKFFFMGFLPRKGTERKKAIIDIISSSCPVIFYESPNRTIKTLQEIAPKVLNRKIVVAREISKVYEEYIRGTGLDILEKLDQDKMRGEITIVIEGKEDGETIDEETMTDEEIGEELKKLLEQGFTKKDAVKSLAEVTGVPKNKIYNIALKM